MRRYAYTLTLTHTNMILLQSKRLTTTRLDDALYDGTGVSFITESLDRLCLSKNSKDGLKIRLTYSKYLTY